MVYQWKGNLGIFKVSAQDAGEELERINEKYGEIQPRDIVNESRDERAVLHKCFEWNDGIAAEEYRKEQAKNLVRCIAIKEEPDKEDADEPREVVVTRAFVNTQNSYRPIHVVMKDETMRDELFAQAKKDIDNFIRKYKNLKRLSKVIDAMEQFKMFDDVS